MSSSSSSSSRSSSASSSSAAAASSARRIAALASHIQKPEEKAARQQNAALVVAPKQTLSATDVFHGVFSTPPNVARHGGDLVADVLEAHGVKFIFTLVGGHISPLLVSSKNRGIRIIDVRHEVNAVFAADAVGRLTGRPGVAAVTAGPGVTNTITAVKNAVMAQSPLVLLGGAAATILQGRGSLQDIDQQVLLRPIVKEVFMARAVRDIVPMLRRAFQVASSGVPGPVFVELPIDVLYPIMETKAGMGLLDRARKKEITGDKSKIKRVLKPAEAGRISKTEYVASLAENQPVFLEPSKNKNSWIADKVVRFSLGRLWGSAFGHDSVAPLPIHVPQATKSEIDQVAQLLRGAKRPVLVCGSGSMLCTEDQAHALQAAINTIGIPTFLGGMSRGLLGRNNPLHIRQGRGLALKQADVVILAGAVCDFRLEFVCGIVAFFSQLPTLFHLSFPLSVFPTCDLQLWASTAQDGQGRCHQSINGNAFAQRRHFLVCPFQGKFGHYIHACCRCACGSSIVQNCSSPMPSAMAPILHSPPRTPLIS
eukprot:INCI16290.3.p1 GENE.INCI16290.3~~INCI16290.3.p1  ORF type:complete len:539 (-),score=85.25 INCI16290.3:36-1652(-)